MTRPFHAHAMLASALRLRPLPDSRGEVSLLPHLAAENTRALLSNHGRGCRLLLAAPRAHPLRGGRVAPCSSPEPGPGQVLTAHAANLHLLWLRFGVWLRLVVPIDGFDHEVKRRPVSDARLGEPRRLGSRRRRRCVTAEVGCVTASASANLGAVEPEPHPLGAHPGAKLGPNQLTYLRARARGLHLHLHQVLVVKPHVQLPRHPDFIHRQPEAVQVQHFHLPVLRQAPESGPDPLIPVFAVQL
mmetsp:Transcript_7714/g.31743  ORF Transcript_7714/g.31743 Transcript_7714/m.31743 type:complete len:244 (-) Transcript_7714:308-1039(-)